METLFELLGYAVGGVVAALVLVWIWGRPKAAAVAKELFGGARKPAPTPAPQPPTPAPEPQPEEFHGAPEVSSLTVRLHALANEFEAFGDNSAHPRDLAQHAKFKEAVALMADYDVSTETVLQYATGANWGLSCAALVALGQRDDGMDVAVEVVDNFRTMRPWTIYFALEFLGSLEVRPPAGAPAVAAKEWWMNNAVIPAAFRDYFTKCQQAGDAAVFGSALNKHGSSTPTEIEAFLKRLNHPFATALIEDLISFQHSSIDREFLRSFGRFWNAREESELLIEAPPWREALQSAENSLGQMPQRSLLLSGERGVGKSSFLRLLSGKLARKGWGVFEASGVDLQAGQVYIGQLEERIRRAVEELAAGKKLIWYIPDMLQVASSGTHRGQSASILDQILPSISAGRLIVWSEATSGEATRLLQARPNLRGLLELIRIEPHSEQEATALATSFCQRLPSQRRLTVDANAIPVALHLARQYVSDEKLPGNMLDLIKRTANRCITDRKKAMTAEDVTMTLSQVTGLPVSILDNKERLDLGAIRNFFAVRVIGQDEAVGAVVDRIAMLKAGLVDSGKPIGVFLFAGPTGTGKTELAKTLAEYLFGSAERLIRLDMSEFQTPESTVKILGESSDRPDTDSLINRVRKQPFSVVLLDEFEKAHARVWDMFLQVFDDARLSDASGRVADFRHCIIILTSNLGATSHRGSGLGFAPAAEEFSPDQINLAIAQTFRPEFQNRLDKVIVFKPLTRELMRGILKKELKQVLERRGLKDRDWAVEWEASAQDFLLEKGFSPEMGARPLKRAIDQYVLAPLAATIVERRFPEGDQFVFVRSDGHGIQAEFVDPNADSRPKAGLDGAGNGARPNLGAMILDPMGTPAERDALDAAAGEIERTIGSGQWDAIKLRLAEEMSKPDFWSRPERHQTLSRLALMDRVQAAANTAESLRARLAKGQGRTQYSRELIARLALQLHVVKLGLQDALEGAPIEVALLIEPALDASGDTQATRKWCAKLAGMYRAWADSRHMQLSEVSNVADKGLPILAISGFGAHRLLLPEVGLHVLEQTEDGVRATARVRLTVAPLGDLAAVKFESAIRDALAKAAPSNAVVRRYRGGASPLVRDASGAWRTGKFDAVMGGDFDLIGATQS